MYGIDLNEELVFENTSMREFIPHEKHIRRVCESDVLVMVISGVLRFNEDGVDYEIYPGEYFIQHFGAIHGDCKESDCPKYLYIHFRGKWADSRTCLPKRGTFIIEDVADDLNKIHSKFFGDGNKTEILSLFYGIMTFLMNGINHTETQAEMILRLLTHDLKNPPSLEQLAEMCHFSKNHIINLVKKEFGMTPYDYLKLERVRCAAKLMNSTSLPLDEISELSGFGDYTGFFRSFKSVHGISPSDWRTEVRS